MEQKKIGKTIYLIRHAESIHNSKISELRPLIEGKEEKIKNEETCKIKFSEDNIDCSISKKGSVQVFNFILSFTQQRQNKQSKHYEILMLS